MRLSDLGAFDAAGKQARRLASGAGLCLVLVAAAPAAWTTHELPAAMTASLAASLIVLAAGTIGATMLARARGLALDAERADAALSTGDLGRGVTRVAPRRRAAAHLAGWGQAAVGGLLACAGLAATGSAWMRSATESPGHAAADAAVLLLAAFAALVVERHLAAVPPAVLPEASALAALVRVPMIVCFLCGLGCLTLYAGISVGAYAGRTSAVLCLLVAAEMIARAVASVFTRSPPITDARLTVASALAAALALRRPRPVGVAIRDHLGLDVSRSWALGFMRAALAPVLTVLALLCWGLSGVDALRVDQRAIYERFGRPVAVLGSGLHLRLPWPFGRLRPVEFGVMHDVAIAFNASGATTPAATPVSAEEPPSAGADRLWDEVHPSDGAYIVASASRGQQSFEIIDIDLHVVYRVGVSDEAARAAPFAVDDPQRLVRSEASRLVAHYLAGHTLAGVLGPDRENFSRDIAAGLQHDLDRASAGMEVMAVVVEAVHPPVGAAAAYHAVQTAEITAHADLAGAAGYAATTGGAARRDAAARINTAMALAHDAVTEAHIAAAAFRTDRIAAVREPDSFVLERRLAKLQAGLAHRQVLILDHRLLGGSGPILDLRPPGSGAVVAPP